MKRAPLTRKSATLTLNGLTHEDLEKIINAPKIKTRRLVVPTPMPTPRLHREFFVKPLDEIEGKKEIKPTISTEPGVILTHQLFGRKGAKKVLKPILPASTIQGRHVKR